MLPLPDTSPPHATKSTPKTAARSTLLQEGSQGEDVRALQSRLNQLGAHLKTDGVFGPATEQAVQQFQTAHHLASDGIVGPQTLAALRDALASTHPIGDVVGQAAGMSFLSASTALLGKSVLGRFDLANAAYQSSGAPAGWTRLNAQQISVLGLNPNHFRSTGSNDVGFRAYLFRSNDDQLVLAFRGSRLTWGGRGDWENDLKQEFGRQSDYYRQAITLAREVSVQTDGKFELVGHSLGGGMAAAAAIVTGAHATTFNAAGINVQTVQPYHKTLEDASKPISGGRHLVDSYIVRGEILDEVQRAPGLQKLVDFISPFPADWLHTVSTDIARATGLNPEPAAGATHYLHDPHPLSGGLSLQTLFGAPDVSHAVSLHGTDAVYAALLNDHIA